ncbi:sulfatase-like hydrolase/transferase [Aliifodinibius sp. S!AR15-10]|uniref:sulfatase-like hydrolase/transferase n=1 Tax=Aliifodinibius sp. S!AR15-10 TaxID=2950437 RepID=UPI0028585485|nr:sulfatase-like hydrolase/transferase [Aliifodinibius sp. S!AR15-10]MDR8394555.1 sulfatase-like hydrolase/transferase [Aliifodinibius sp. S!AR15-10]
MFFIAIIIFLLFNISLGLSQHNVEEEVRPNVVIFLTDDQGTLDVNSYGAKDLITPNIDQLAKEGIRFTQAYAHTVCVPTRAGLLTGRYPQRGGINSWTQGNAHAEKGVNMYLDEVTIAEVLKRQGYQTALFGKWHLGADLNYGPLSQGFDYFYGHRGGFIDNFQHSFLHGEGFHDLWRNKEEIYENGQYFPNQTIEEAKKYINRNLDKPKFLYIALNIPHYPEQPYVHKLKFEYVYEDLEQPRRSYAHMVSTADYLIGEIIQHLKNKGEYENTLFVFMSDNGHSEEDYQIGIENHTSGLPKGTNYGANGGGGFTGKWVGHKGTFREGGIRVPFIISYPARLPKNVKRDQVVTNMDILPTLCDLLHIRLPNKRLDGFSLLPIIQDNASSAYKDQVLHFQWQNQWAVRKGNWKLISDRNEELHLSNLEEENPERKNWISEYPKIVENLMEMHKSWAQEIMSDGELLK